MESEIQGLEDLTGYFVQQDKVVFIRFHPLPRRRRAMDLIERIIPPVEHRPLDPEALSAMASGASDVKEKGEKETVENGMNLNLFTA